MRFLVWCVKNAGGALRGWNLGIALLPVASALLGCHGSAACDRVEVEPAGRHVARFLDAMDVEHHWIAGHHVRWRTGEPDGRPVPSEGHHSHCSAFVAAVATRLGVEILRPPEHSQTLLANAQCQWLTGEGIRSGWHAVDSPRSAQERANRGDLVVACWIDPEPTLPGHIAIVRPAALSLGRIAAEGPQITQAGIENFRSVGLAEGFRHHPQAWPGGGIRFYGHALSPSKASPGGSR